MSTPFGHLRPRLATRAVDAGHAASNACHRWRGWRPWAALLLVVLGGLTLVSASMRDASVGQVASSLAVEPPSFAVGPVMMPSAATDGVLTMAIPLGAAAEQQAGRVGYQMPAVISLAVGDTILLRNDDDVPHMILYAFLRPGATHERTFTVPGSEVYSAGCGVHAAAMLNFTTIFVREPA